MDGRRFIDALFSNQNNYSITQVVMNLPNDAAEFLGMFLNYSQCILFLLVIICEVQSQIYISHPIN